MKDYRLLINWSKYVNKVLSSSPFAKRATKRRSEWQEPTSFWFRPHKSKTFFNYILIYFFTDEKNFYKHFYEQKMSLQYFETTSIQLIFFFHFTWILHENDKFSKNVYYINNKLMNIKLLNKKKTMKFLVSENPLIWDTLCIILLPEDGFGVREKVVRWHRNDWAVAK